MIAVAALVIGYGALLALIVILHHLAKKAERDGNWRP